MRHPKARAVLADRKQERTFHGHPDFVATAPARVFAQPWPRLP
ncbi:hypothetical protein BZL30_6765 [Mycobacterium kansasii]|uniref:Uncharacterized protein n=1 Tax=Mycobacterium kansasii TaxID=1768 RepID=A0A1V3WPT4_MYCKA|nr:hypothetical protein BZL30_6765 [Mycobacterium kansasii]